MCVHKINVPHPQPGIILSGAAIIGMKMVAHVGTDLFQEIA
jgi:hypothetical protein